MTRYMFYGSALALKLADFALDMAQLSGTGCTKLIPVSGESKIRCRDGVDPGTTQTTVNGQPPGLPDTSFSWRSTAISHRLLC